MTQALHESRDERIRAVADLVRDAPDAIPGPITFGTSDYDNGASQTTGVFRDTANNSTINQVDDGGNGILRFTAPSSGTLSAATFYDTTPSNTSTLNTFGDVTIRADVRFGITTGNGVGIYARTDSSGQAAYMFLLTGDDTTNTLRLFKTSSSSTAYGGNAGTQIGSSVGFSGVSANTFYTMEFTLANTAGPAGVALTGKLFQQGTMTQIGNTISFTDTTSPLLSNGQVGLRFRDGSGAAASQTDVDNFTVVPEPTTFAMLLGGMGVLLMKRRRR